MYVAPDNSYIHFTGEVDINISLDQVTFCYGQSTFGIPNRDLLAAR